MTDIEDLDADEGTPDPVHRVLGKQIKHLREQAGLTQTEFGRQAGYGTDLVSSVERGRRAAKPQFIDAAERILDARGLLKAVEEDIDKARLRYPAFFREFARLETEAVELHEYATMVVPGLLQTEEYARALYRMRRPLLDEETVEARVAARLARQQIFSRWPPPTLSFVLEEVVLQRPFGSADVLRGQLRQLLALGRMRHVELQVMPTKRSDHPGVAGPVILLETREGQNLAYAEAQGRNVWFTKREAVRTVESRYGIIRAQALTPDESLGLIETLLGEG
ncbi:helix-turn-helix transcriptional regulator [Streptomyces sp. WMMB 322]|uniref:helix-turn-helix domain-containing protein n=1 Tax=Streptomyces sp. WMMB 322 TaxID=1286821 RepID=UPI0006E319A0|nr:helix-turn-helix transcriptional regulator [Streptomyces sp. WMMB 322]SCK52376.1 Helix-turn-helix domain-containing protein [Streptomyces sp. WMMB 322]